MYTIWIFLFGLIFGSFLNVVIYRLQQGLSIVFPGSSCPACKKPIRFYDNIPLLSYILLKGRCRQCGSSISWRYPFVEGLTALCLSALFFKYGLSFQFLNYGILVLFLIPISFIDIDKGLILNKLTIPCFILGVGLVLGFQFETWENSLFGAVGGGGIVWLMGFMGKMLFRKESLGFGDVKLLVTIGVYVGFPEVAICLFLGICIAGIFIFGGLILKKLSFGNTIPFGPFIALGTLVYLIWGPSLVNWYMGLY
ncbi:prepilin peptidase [bacterium]|nr:prepilin peptidase [bacterium]